jgi:hypothetical protein
LRTLAMSDGWERWCWSLVGDALFVDYDAAAGVRRVS